jgi:hypothetical protein
VESQAIHKASNEGTWSIRTAPISRTFRERRFAIAKSWIHAEKYVAPWLTPKEQKEQDTALLELYPPQTAKQAILLYLANGNGFKRSEVRKLFGRTMRTGTDGDVNPSFWKFHTEQSPAIDLAIQDTILGMFPHSVQFGDSGEDLQTLVFQVTDEIEEVLSSFPLPSDARRILAEEYRKYEQQQNGEPEPEQEFAIPF